MPPKKPIGGKGGALAGNAAAPGNVPGPGAPMAPGEPVAPKAGSRRLSVAAGTGTAAAAAGRRGAALRRASQAGSRTPVRETTAKPGAAPSPGTLLGKPPIEAPKATARWGPPAGAAPGGPGAPAAPQDAGMKPAGPVIEQEGADGFVYDDFGFPSAGNLRQAPNVLLICSVLVTYLLFVAVCIIIIKYAYQGYDIEAHDVFTSTQNPDLVKITVNYKLTRLIKKLRSFIHGTKKPYQRTSAKQGLLATIAMKANVTRRQADKRIFHNGTAGPRRHSAHGARLEIQEDYVAEVLENGPLIYMRARLPQTGSVDQTAGTQRTSTKIEEKIDNSD